MTDRKILMILFDLWSTVTRILDAVHRQYREGFHWFLSELDWYWVFWADVCEDIRE